MLWARQLFTHIKEPMDLIALKKPILHTTQGKAVVDKYNKVALELTEYELLHYHKWLNAVNHGCRNLQVIIYLDIIISDYSLMFQGASTGP